ncbi:dihydrofolate reductase [Patescibacteria group bacterium]
MPQPTVSMIAAISENRGLGKDNKLIFRIKEDLQHFKKMTSGHPVIMGRKTFESIGRPLPNRTNIIITRNADYQAEKCVIVDSLEEAMQRAADVDQEEVFIIGGGQIFEESMPVADKLYLTIVKGAPEADVFFPEYGQFSKVISKKESSGEGFNYTFFELEKNNT